ncbi:MAG: T9SS type A sorting domain-containing protein [Bacteroidetes bacterium]|nr:T9SS type A sorting domain-containing protein [Bacteroidota bacterium]
MLKKNVLIIFAMWISMYTQAQKTDYKVISNNETQTVLDIQIGAINRVPVATEQGQANKICIEGATQLQFKDCPDLPKIALPIIIPNTKNSKLEILETEYVDYTNILIAPGKGSLPRTISPSKIPYTFGDLYKKDVFFPKMNAELNTPYIVRDFRGQTLFLYPVQYNPITRIMRVYSRMKVKVIYEGLADENILSSNSKPDMVVEEFDGMYKNRFINYKTLGTRYSPMIEQGSLAIFTPGKYLNEILPFVQWKEMKGIKTYVVNTDTLSGGVDTLTIKNLAKYYYQTKQIAYLLIVGDYADIPSRLTGVAGPSDNGYAYISNGDHYPEFIVGRFSGETTDEIKTQVDRSLAYEKTPNTATNWMSTQIGIGSEEGTGDDNQYDWEHMHDIVDSNKNQYKYLNNYEMYDGINAQAGNDLAGNPGITMLKDAINEGASLINYIGHGSINGIVTTGFESANISLLNNYNKLPFMMTVGCKPGSFVGITCFAETLQRAGAASTPYGTIGAFMSSIDQWWDEPMQAQDEFNAIMRGARPSNLKSRLGAMCMDACMSMNDQYDVFSNPNGPFAGSAMTDTWMYFGDPTIALYTKNEGALSIDYDVHIQQNKTTYEIHCPVNGATIGLYYQGKYLASSVSNGGMAYFTFPALSALDTVFITATKQNYVPAFGKALVVNWPNEVAEFLDEDGISVYPNPADNYLQIQTNAKNVINQIELYDLSGKFISKTSYNQSIIVADTKHLAAGRYLVKIKTTKGVYHKNFNKR